MGYGKLDAETLLSIEPDDEPQEEFPRFSPAVPNFMSDPTVALSYRTFALLLAVALVGSGCSGSPTATEVRRSPLQKSGGDASVADQALREASFESRIEAVREALDTGADVNGADEEKRTPLMLAAFNGSTDVARLLLDRGARVNDRDQAGRTALMYASSGPHDKTVQLLLDRDADVNVIDGQEGWTALMFAAAEGHADVVQSLLDHGADTTVRDVDGDTALGFAEQNGHAEVVRALKDGP